MRRLLHIRIIRQNTNSVTLGSWYTQLLVHYNTLLPCRLTVVLQPPETEVP